MSAVAQLENEPVRASALVSTTPADLLRLAVERGASMEQIEKFMDLNDRWEATQARKSYNEAMSQFRREQIVVLRSETVTDGPLKGKSYAKLSDFVNAAVPALSACGLSATWRITRDEKDWIEVACIVSHLAGHQESTTMGGPPDAGGAKNAIQARASTVSYLEKYTLKMALGLAEQNDDNDGSGAPVTMMTEDHSATIQAKAEEIGPKMLGNVLRSYKVGSLSEIPDIEYASIIGRLEATAKKGAI